MRRLLFFTLLLYGLFSFPVFGAGPIEIRPERGGGALENLSLFRIYFRDKKMQVTTQYHQAFPAKRANDPDKENFRGIWPFPDGTLVNFDFNEKVSPDGMSAELTYTLRASGEIECDTLSLRFDLNGAEFAGRIIGCDDYPMLLPEKFDKSRLFLGHLENLRRITIPLRTGMLVVEPPAGSRGMVYDHRNATDDFKLDISFLPRGAATFREAEMKVKLRMEPYRTEALPLNLAANSAFDDGENGDCQGGWTDQGSSLDLRMIPPGDLKAGFARFRILNAAENQGKSCIVLGGGGRNYLPKKAELPVPDVCMRTLLLLHGTAWPTSGETGTITLTFADGSEQKIPVISGTDVGNWWNPTTFANFQIGFQAPSSDGQNVLGLGYSCFNIKKRPVRKIVFESSGKSVWMIGALSSSAQMLTFQRQQAYTFRRNADWRKVSSVRDIVPGSALDFSFLLDAPAGKHGFLTVGPDGHFRFEKQQRNIRFYGTNLAGTTIYLPEAKQERLADIFARIGYNAVRLHHIDLKLKKSAAEAPLKYFDKNSLQLLDHMIYALKKRGIYITIDLFSARPFLPGDLPELPTLSIAKDYKLAVMLHPAANADLKAYARELLTHRNEFTGMTLAEDPVLFGICVLNENTIYDLYEEGRLFGDKGGEGYRYCNRIFEEGCRKKGIDPDGKNRPQLMRRFLGERYEAYWNDMVKFLRDELKVHALLTDQNHHQSQLLYSMRSKYDYVDNHYYWDHPAYLGPNMWGAPFQIRNSSSLAAEVLPFRLMAPTRVLGKPFTVTEFRWCYPNEYRAEGAPMMSAYASLQDWDALFHFDMHCYWEAAFQKDYCGPFSVGNDLPSLLLERLAVAFFIRRDVATSDITVPVAVKPDDFDSDYVDGYPNCTQRLPFLVKTGSVGYANGAFDHPLPKDALAILSLVPDLRKSPLPVLSANCPSRELLRMLGKSETSGQIESSTDELTADFGELTFKAATPCSEALVLPAGKTLSGKTLSATARKGFSVVAVVAVDSRPLKESKRILLLHTTDIRQENICYLSEENRVIVREPAKEDVILGRRGIADVTLKLGPGKFTVRALERDGSVLGEVPSRTLPDGIALTADTFCFADKVVFAYEIVRQ